MVIGLVFLFFYVYLYNSLFIHTIFQKKILIFGCVLVTCYFLNSDFWLCFFMFYSAVGMQYFYAKIIFLIAITKQFYTTLSCYYTLMDGQGPIELLDVNPFPFQSGPVVYYAPFRGSNILLQKSANSYEPLIDVRVFVPRCLVDLKTTDRDLIATKKGVFFKKNIYEMPMGVM